MITAIEVAMKICTKCKQNKSLSDFSKRTASPDGLCYRCKSCDIDYQVVHKEEITEKRQIPEVKEYHRKYSEKKRTTIRGHLQDVFSNMKKRCTNSKIKNYNRYGGRNIQVKFKSFDDFLDCVNELKVDPRGLQIDRIDNDGDYEKGNIRFCTAKENNNNRSNNRRKK